MPWGSTTVTEERLRFGLAYQKKVLTGKMSMSALCAEFSIARKSGYKFLARQESEGWAGLADRSRAPLSGCHWIEPQVREAILQVKRELSDFGAKKIVAHLHRVDPDRAWPSVSAVHQTLKRAGLVERKANRRCSAHPGAPPPFTAKAPNEEWSADFKGQFRTRDRRYCYPLTIADTFSRCLLSCVSLLQPSFEQSWRVFDQAFREYGVPESIRSDNGPPFASTALRRLSQLSVRWIRLGIRPVLIEPGHPQQNARHERMHRTLKEGVCSSPAANWREQQKDFDHFRKRFNEVRPHESLGQIPPAEIYSSSPRPYPAQLPPIEYPSSVEVRRVNHNGVIKWQGRAIFLTEVLAGEHVAVRAVDDGVWLALFGPVLLGYYSQRDQKFYPDKEPA